MSSSWPCGLFWKANSSTILPSSVLTHATQRVLWTSNPTLFKGVSLTSCVGWPTATCINSSFHASGSPVRVVAESEPIHQTSRQAAQRAFGLGRPHINSRSQLEESFQAPRIFISTPRGLYVCSLVARIYTLEHVSRPQALL